jgi:hypothetical protein
MIEPRRRDALVLLGDLAALESEVAASGHESAALIAAALRQAHGHVADAVSMLTGAEVIPSWCPTCHGFRHVRFVGAVHLTTCPTCKGAGR